MELSESAKRTHEAVDYTDDSPCGPLVECSNCVNFIATDRDIRCAHVKSPIVMYGWCELYKGEV